MTARPDLKKVRDLLEQHQRYALTFAADTTARELANHTPYLLSEIEALREVEKAAWIVRKHFRPVYTDERSAARLLNAALDALEERNEPTI